MTHGLEELSIFMFSYLFSPFLYYTAHKVNASDDLIGWQDNARKYGQSQYI